MNRSTSSVRRFTLLLTAASVLVAFARTSLADTYVAFSLQQAEVQLKEAGVRTREIAELGGITEPLAVVFDNATKDLILVGKANPKDRPITVDDFIVALRAIVKQQRWPLVSIDEDEHTAVTKKQHVRFEGGIDNTAFGNDLLAADVVLKKLALGDMSAEVWGVKSYFEMLCKRSARPEDLGAVRSRFWFVGDERGSACTDREGVMVMDRLNVAVETQAAHNTRAQAGDGQDDIGISFAQCMSASYADLAREYPALHRAQTLFKLVGITTGIRMLSLKYSIFQPNLTYWLENYEVTRIATPTDYPLIEKKRSVENGRGTVRVEVNGGVQLAPLIVELRDGSLTALREIVVLCRPNGTAVTWQVPLSNWKVPGDFDVDLDANPEKSTSGAPNRNARDDGFSLSSRVSWVGAGSGYIGAIGSSTWPEIHAGVPAFPPPASSSSRAGGNVGGVMLSGTAKVAGADGQPATASVDLTGGNFSLVVDGKNARIAPAAYRKFITALWCVYYSDRDPGISLDPIAPSANQHLVRYIGRVINTDLGRVMREADYCMKKWAIGTEKPDFQGFQSVDDLMARLGRSKAGVSRRFWFVPEDFSFKEGDDLLLFAGGRIRVKTEYADQAANQGAPASDKAFAEFFTTHYDQLAARYPVYKELFEYAKLVALAKYLKQQGVPLQWFLMANKELVLTEDAPGTVAQLAKNSEHFANITITGGVDLKSEGQYVYDRQAVSAIRQAMAQMPSSEVHTTGTANLNAGVRCATHPFTIDVGNQSYSILPQHTLTSGKDGHGVRYQTDFALRRGDQPGLELVRCYDPRNRQDGDFGQGWQLLIPYRVAAVDKESQLFHDINVPRRMKLINLFSGAEEVLKFSEDRYTIAGYVPDRLSDSQYVGLFLLTNAQFRLADKLGNQFHFDQAGRLTEMCFSADRAYQERIEYVGRSTDAFERTPYAVEAVNNEQVSYRGGVVWKQIKVSDMLHGESELFTFSADKMAIPGYVPAEKASRYRFAAMLSNSGLKLLDKHNNEINFGRRWEFSEVSLPHGRSLVRSVAMAGRKAEFRYAIDNSGRVLISRADLSADLPNAPPFEVVRYEHDDEGRLCGVERLTGAALSEIWPQAMARR